MELEYIIRAFLALAFVAGLIGITAFLFKKYALQKGMASNAMSKQLTIKEQLYLDAKRRLLLVKNGEKEILILLSPNSETVIANYSAAQKHAKPATKSTTKPR